jgi:hypothetical protein
MVHDLRCSARAGKACATVLLLALSGHAVCPRAQASKHAYLAVHGVEEDPDAHEHEPDGERHEGGPEAAHGIVCDQLAGVEASVRPALCRAHLDNERAWMCIAA